MKPKPTQIFTTVLLVIALSGITLAQVTTSSINGIILDENSEGLPGATILATHTPTGTQYGTSSRIDGRYTLPNLKIGGPYTIVISFVGYEDKTREGIFLVLGESFKADFNLKTSAQELEEIVISAAGQFDEGRTGPETVIDNNTLTGLPTITRSAADIYRLNPLASGNSFAGRNDQYNNFSLDGSIFNNPFGLDAATPGGQTNAQPVSLDAIDQIKVAIAPFDVTQAGFTGASVNAVTKSGTNEFHGTVFGFYRNQSLTGQKVGGEDFVVPDLSQSQFGFSIGGPLVKNKLFFFANMEIERREDLGSTFVADRGQNGENVSRVLASDLDLVRSTLSGLGYETGPYEGYTHRTDNEKGIFKLDWNINKSNSFTATYNFLNASRDLNAHPTAIGRRGPDLVTLQFQNSGYTINNKIQSGIIELNSILGNKYSNKFQAGFTHFDDSRDPFSEPFPVLNINKNGTRYIVAGHEPFSINNRLDQKVYQVTNNFDIYMGDHTITIGTALEKFEFDNSFNLGVYDDASWPAGTFGPGFDDVAAFVAYAGTPGMQTAINYAEGVYSDKNANDSWALAETNVGQWGFYVQDKWNLNDNVTISIGLRGDKPLYFDTPDKIQENINRNCCYDPSIDYFDTDGNTVNFDHLVLPDPKILWSPRIGFNYDVNGDRTFQIRGGSGLFSGRFPFVWVGNHVANPNFWFYNVTDPDFQFPQVWKNNLGMDKKFNGGWTFTFDLLYSKDRNAMMVRNYGFNKPSGTLNAPGDNRAIYDSSTDRALVFGSPTNAYVFTNSNLGNATNVTLEVRKDFESGWKTSLAYNFLDSKDVSSIEAEISSDAFERNATLDHVNDPLLQPSIYGNRHRVVGTINRKFVYGQNMATTVSLFFEYAQGGRYSYTYAGDINNDGVFFGNDLIYIPTDAQISQMVFTTGGSATEQQQRDAFRAFIEQDPYLSERRGEYAERNGALSPWYSTWDLRILQDLMIADSKKLQFSIDLLNAGNLISSNWGVRRNPTLNQPIGVVSVDGSGIPTYAFDTSLKDSFSDSFDLLSRWQLQFGLRFSF